MRSSSSHLLFLGIAIPVCFIHLSLYTFIILVNHAQLCHLLFLDIAIPVCFIHLPVSLYTFIILVNHAQR